LQPVLPGAQQEGGEHGEGEDAPAGEVFRAGAVGVDEGRVAQGGGEIRQDRGKDTASLMFLSCGSTG
jgi:hypothetical protein